MRFAFISDIHGNLQACQTVLADITTRHVDTIICLGDMIGYGPQPAETLNVLHEKIDYFVMGNHDAALCGMLPLAAFSDDAAAMIRWTRENVDQKAVDFLKKLPLTIHSEQFICAHGTAADPETFGYIYGEEDTRACLQASDRDLVFVGHTHLPGIRYLNRDDVYREVAATDFILEDGKRYVVNPGSVGMSRDGDFRASYCIFDTDEVSITFHRVAFDIESLRALAEGDDALSAQLGHMLAGFDDSSRAPVRESIDFSPVTHNDSVFVEQSRISQGRLFTWKAISAILLVCSLAISLVAWKLSSGAPPQPRVIESQISSIVTLNPQSTTPKSLLGTHSSTEINTPLEILSLTLNDPLTQRVRQPDPDQLVIINPTPNTPVELTAPAISRDGIDKVQVYLLLHATQPVAIPPTVFIDYLKIDGTVVRNAVTKTAVPVRGKEGVLRIQKTTPTIPDSVKTLRIRFQWLGAGELHIETFTVQAK